MANITEAYEAWKAKRAGAAGAEMPLAGPDMRTGAQIGSAGGGEPPRASESVGGVYEQWKAARQNKADRLPQAASERGVGQRLLEDTLRNIAATEQRTNPSVRDFGGDLNYRRLGRATDSDAGPMGIDDRGQWFALNPRVHVLMTDPQSGEPTIFARSERTDDPVWAGLARMVTMGAATSAPQGLLPAAASKTDLLSRATGMAPDQIPETLSRSFAQQARRSGDTMATARTAAANEFGVPLSRGQASGNINQQAFEQAALHGARGETAQRIVGGFDTRQKAAIDAARQNIGTTLAGGTSLVDDAFGATERAAEAVARKAGALKQNIRSAYEQVPMRELQLDAEGVRGVARDVVSRLDAENVLIFDDTPQAAKALKDVEDLASLRPDAAARLRRVVGKPINDAAPLAVDLERIERTRRLLNDRISSTTPGTADRRATTAVKRAYDQWIDDAVDNTLFSGSAEGLDKLKEARSLRAQYGKMFEGDGAVSRMIDKMVQREATPGEVSNWLYGASQVGLKGDSVRLARRLGDILGRDTPEWQAIRQGLWHRLTDVPGGNNGAQAVATRIQKFVAGDGVFLANVMFTPAERAEMRRFAGVLKLTVPDPKATNRSGSGYEVARMLQAFASALGFTQGGIAGGVAGNLTARVLPSLWSALRARRAAQGAPRVRPRTMAPIISAQQGTAEGLRGR